VLEESGYEDGYIAWSIKPIALRNFMNTQCSPRSRQLSGNQNPSVNNQMGVSALVVCVKQNADYRECAGRA